MLESSNALNYKLYPLATLNFMKYILYFLDLLLLLVGVQKKTPFSNLKVGQSA